MEEHGDVDISKLQFIPLKKKKIDDIHLLTKVLQHRHISKPDLVEQVPFPSNLQTDYHL